MSVDARLERSFNAMKLTSRERAIVLTIIYCCAAGAVCGAWSLAFPIRLGWSSSFRIEDVVGYSDHDVPSLTSSKIRTAAARSLTSTETASPSEEDPLPLEGELLDLQSSLPELYHSPEVFALNYEEMTKNLRVYIYPPQIEIDAKYEFISNGDDELGTEPSSATEFYQLLATSSNFLTRDPDQAHLFFLPVSIDAIYATLGPAGVGSQLREYVQSVRTSYAFWDRSLGADHFYLSNHAYEPVSHRNYLELRKNAIQVACAPLRLHQAFFPHKDIVLPFYKSLDKKVAANPKRSKLAHFSTATDVDPVSASMLQTWSSDSDFDVETDASMTSSRFCISASPHAMRNVVDALRLGCVPVLISDSVIYDLPFQDILNWRQFVVVIGVNDIPNLKKLLTEISQGKYQKMQYLGYQASKHMEWNNPPVAYDAFHMTMSQLWLRRHSIKYSRRSDSV